MPYSNITLQAITYRIIVIILDAVVLYFFLDSALEISMIVIARHVIQTENIVVAAEGTLVISIVNTIAYYLHDRYWEKRKQAATLGI